MSNSLKRNSSSTKLYSANTQFVQCVNGELFVYELSSYIPLLCGQIYGTGRFIYGCSTFITDYFDQNRNATNFKCNF